MDRQEAILRELNLYPLWVLRGGGREAAGHPAAKPLQGQHEQPVHDPAPPQVMPSVAKAEEEAGSLEVTVQPPVAQTSRQAELAQLGWPELKARVRDCTMCRLRAGCTQTVFGVGDEQADWLFVGEGPGADEDARGEPFVGQAGKLLDNMLLAMQLQRGNNVYIGNIVKCRPPGNRAPEPDEIATCLPYLHRQIELIQPKLIVALGKTASNALLGRDAALASLRGKLHDYHGIPLIVTYHPAYLLRTPMEKVKAWQDLRLALQTYADFKKSG